METKTVTVAEFLLERIAEDEAHANGWCEDYCACLERQHPGHRSPARVLAECEAKRLIIGWARTEDGGPDPLIAAVLADALGHLASVYADHPDYRPEWAL